MEKEILKKIKQELLERREQILKNVGEITSVSDGSVMFPAYGDKLDENAQEVGDYETNVAKDASLEKTLRDIEGALDRIEKGTYGVCKYCNQEINAKRLQARPVASACIPCKTKLQNA
ncbi:TraR/DksA C4-type zinc finger protein [Patescibacteria group bacterium]|nr:TraR/DksA C4-type zinc finger protein [Patescibacteria group bacterium]